MLRRRRVLRDKGDLIYRGRIVPLGITRVSNLSLGQTPTVTIRLSYYKWGNGNGNQNPYFLLVWRTIICNSGSHFYLVWNNVRKRTKSTCRL